MISLKHIANYPAGVSLVADDLVEFHAARIILMLKICGSRDRNLKLLKINGLTKIAKLDFFIRYPEFLKKISEYLNKENLIQNIKGGVESRMIRFYYGPWDKRYYQLIPFLESRELLFIKKEEGYTFYLTSKGEEIANQLIKQEDFNDIVNNINAVDKVLSNFSGSYLKNMIYKIFEEEVSSKSLGDIIK